MEQIMSDPEGWLLDEEGNLVSQYVQKDLWGIKITPDYGNGTDKLFYYIVALEVWEHGAGNNEPVLSLVTYIATDRD